MILRKALIVSVVFALFGVVGGGCQSGGVGDPCIPEDEYQPSFSGFAAAELNIESRSFQCETRVCLVNHFRGRVSCPLGQTAETAAKAAAYSAHKANPKGALPANYDPKFDPQSPDGCRLPGSTGASADVVNTSVLPQCTTRQAKDTVYCSCRCDGPDPNAKYCECGAGFTCKKFDELDVGVAAAKGSGNLRGSYCVKEQDSKSADYSTGDCPNAVGSADSCLKSGNCGATVNP
jgi:hypothetical protein